MAYQIEYTTRFSKSLKLCAKRGLDMDLFETVSNLLRETGTVPDEYLPHPLIRQIHWMLGMPHPTKLASGLEKE